MNINISKHLILFLCLCGFAGLSSCLNIEDKRTTISVVDADRHYPPILFGQIIKVVYEVENTGDQPLFVKDIQVSGGCELTEGNKLKVLPSKSKGFIHVLYDGRKNIGYVKNYITLYANFESGDKIELTFDLNVVPNALYTKDYEEVHKEKNRTFVEELVDGSENERRYTID